MDIGYVSTPLLVDCISVKIALQDVFLIVWYGTIVRVMVIFCYNNGPQPLLLHMTLHTFQAAWDAVLVQDAAYLHGSIAALGFLISPLYLTAEFFIGLLPV